MKDWYVRIGSQHPITQGEVLFKCPVMFPHPELDYRSLGNPAEVTYILQPKDVMVMSQGCDLEKAKPEYGVILCAVTSLLGVTSEGQAGNLSKNKTERYHLLNHCPTFSLDYLVVDFGTVYTVPYATLNTWANGLSGQRFRLDSPFLEQMSQRYGNFYARIGIENDDQPKVEELLSRWRELHRG